jgi:WD40 repeat protein
MTDTQTLLQNFQQNLGKLMWDAYNQLLDSTSPHIEQILFKYSPYRYFECCCVMQIINSWGGWGMKLAIDPNEKFLISCVYRAIEKWDIETKQKIWKLEVEDSIIDISISFDGSILLTTPISDAGKPCCFWDIQTGNIIYELYGFTQACFDKFQSIIHVCNPNFSSNKLSYVLNLMQHKYQISYYIASRIYDTSFRNVLASKLDGQILIWNTLTGCLVDSFNGHSKEVDDVSVCGNLVVSISEESYHSNIVFWDLNQKEILDVLSIDFRVASCVAFCDDERVFALGCLQGLSIWDAKLRREICFLNTEEVEDVIFSDNGKMIISGHRNGEILFWTLLSLSED